MSEPAVIIAYITTIGGLVGLLIGAVSSYLNTHKKKDDTLPVIPTIEINPQTTIDGLRDLLKRETESKSRYRELWQQEQRNFIAAMNWGQKLTRQIRRHAPEINPADYEPPNGSEPRILPPK